MTEMTQTLLQTMLLGIETGTFRLHQVHELRTMFITDPSICQSRSFAVQHGWTDRGPVWRGHSWGPTEHETIIPIFRMDLMRPLLNYFDCLLCISLSADANVLLLKVTWSYPLLTVNGYFFAGIYCLQSLGHLLLFLNDVRNLKCKYLCHDDWWILDLVYGFNFKTTQNQLLYLWKT